MHSKSMAEADENNHKILIPCKRGGFIGWCRVGWSEITVWEDFCTTLHLHMARQCDGGAQRAALATGDGVAAGDVEGEGQGLGPAPARKQSVVRSANTCATSDAPQCKGQTSKILLTIALIQSFKPAD